MNNTNLDKITTRLDTLELLLNKEKKQTNRQLIQSIHDITSKCKDLESKDKNIQNLWKCNNIDCSKLSNNLEETLSIESLESYIVSVSDDFQKNTKDMEDLTSYKPLLETFKKPPIDKKLLNNSEKKFDVCISNVDSVHKQINDYVSRYNLVTRLISEAFIHWDRNLTEWEDEISRQIKNKK